MSKPTRAACLFELLMLMGMVAPRLCAQAGAAGETKASIEGVVVSLPSGAAIRHAQVELFAGKNEEPAYSMETDVEGRFSFADVAPGEYRLVGDKSGYTKPKGNCGGSDVRNGDKIEITVGRKLTGVRLELLAPAAIEGTVYDANGEPVARADLNALRSIAQFGRRTTATIGFAQSDDHGHFRLFYLAPGQYYVSVGHDFPLEREDRPDAEDEGPDVKGFLPIYYGDTTDLSAATTIELKAGEEFSGADITVRPSEVLRVRGRVLNGITGEPLKEALTMIEPLDQALEGNRAGKMFFGVKREDGGYVESDLTPGRYALMAFTASPVDHHQWGGSREIELTDTSLDGIDVRAYPGEDIHGVLEMADGGKLPGHDLRVALYGRIRVPVRPSIGDVKADVTFVLNDATAGTYDVRVMGLPENNFVKTARMGTVDVLENGVKIGGGGSGGTLVVRLSAAAADLEGGVEDADGKAACSGDVVLIPEGGRRMWESEYPSGKIDSSGHFAIQGIAAGDYRAFAWEDEYSVAYREAGVMEAIEKQGTRLRLEEGDRKTVKLNWIRAQGKNP